MSVLWKRLSRTGRISAEGPSSRDISTTTEMRVRVLASVSRTSFSLRFLRGKHSIELFAEIP